MNFFLVNDVEKFGIDRIEGIKGVLKSYFDNSFDEI